MSISDYKFADFQLVERPANHAGMACRYTGLIIHIEPCCAYKKHYI